MTRAPDADLGQGTVYFLDPASLVVHCPHCRSNFQHTSPPIVCPHCQQVVSADHVQREPRPMIAMTETSLVPLVSVITVVPVTTRPQPRETSLEFQGGVVPGIPKTSYAMFHQLLAVNKASFYLENKKGALPPAALALLKAGLHKYLGL